MAKKKMNWKFDALKLSDLPAASCGVLRKASNTRPTIWIVEKNGIRAVVKDFSRNRFLFRNIVGRFLIWREAKAYRKLAGIKGVPAFYGVIGGLALVSAFHQRGLAHCDLKRAPNTLVGLDGMPHIVDWAASISKRELRLPPFNLIFRRFMLDDEMAIVKLALRHCPDRVSAEKRARYHY